MASTISPFDPSLPANPRPAETTTADASSEVLPKVGQIRCYWALLSEDLHFLYIDPVLQNHLDAQATSFIGKSLIEFVHPDEQASAKQDLGDVLASRTLHGSVTRVRFSRLSRVRRELGHQGLPAPWSDADKVAVDFNYMAVDLVINWAAEGLVLCFMHAVVDINPKDDNNEKKKTGWTNWCGTPSMSSSQAHLLYQRLAEKVPRPRDAGRIFQVLLNQPERPLWVSWPPDPARLQAGRASSRDFANLADGIYIGNTENGSDAKTSCTRRYKAQQQLWMGPEGSRSVESIFIPHGSIIFACHEVDFVSPPRPPQSEGNDVGYPNSSYPHHSQPFYNNPPPPFGIPPMPNYPQQSNMAAPFHPPEQRWSGSNPNHYGDEWQPNSTSPSTSNTRSGIYMSSQNNQHQWPSQPPSYNLDPHQQRSMSPYPYSQAVGENGSEDGSSGEVPPPRSSQRRGAARDQYGSGGRSTGKPPVGVNKCASCKITQSPEWRKGPSGKKDLCNACGLRFARSRAKKEGNTSARRRKEKSFSMKQESQQESLEGSHAGSSNSGGRRNSANFNESSFPLPHGPSGKGSSQSPPSRAANYSHYPEQNPQTHSPSSLFNYPLPSPSMPDPASLHHSPRNTSLPRLNSTSYSARVGHSSSNSPISAGPPTHASSFERDSGGGESKGTKRQREPSNGASEWSRKPPPFKS